MPRQNSTSWASWEAVAASRLNDFNEDIDDLYATGSDHLKVYHLAAQPALQVTIGPGTYRVWGTEWQYAGGTLTVGASVTTYIMIDTTGTIQTSTSAWNSLYTRLAVVVSGASTITSITDWRNKVVGGVLWGLVFDDTRGSWTTPNTYNDSTFKAQLKNLSDIGLNGIASWTYARLLGWRWQTSSTYWNAFETAYTDDWIYHRNWATTTWWAWRKNIDATNVENWLTINWTYTALTAASSYYWPLTANSSSVLIVKPTVGRVVCSSGLNMGAYAQKVQKSPDNSTWSDVYSFTWDSLSRDFPFILQAWYYYRTQSNSSNAASNSSWSSNLYLTV